MQYSYLALGDSYTIGESVLLSESFPYQTVQLLRSENALAILSPEIIAKTGWTTDELSAQIDQTVFLKRYDIVSLLIGVNNQYRERTAENFLPEFESLLQRAIAFSGNQPSRVFVLSIPDWGRTPFAEGRDREKISAEIDAYNKICTVTASRYGCHFIDITTAQRKDNDDPDFVAADKLHPSKMEYEKWARELQKFIFEAVGS
ncbi:MAG: hydrolase family protein [Ferruginibacter sp.]|nr:hydrolase family protein [Ferruginibacter sp.]